MTICSRELSVNKGYLMRFGPPVLVLIGWWTWALLNTEIRLGRFVEDSPYVGQYYYMTIAMLFGSLVAGATSEGGGAVAYPVMTLLLGVPPLVARDFSFGIQAFGMTVASITIFGLGVPVDYEALVWASLGGASGLVVGLVGIAPYLPPAYAKMLFVSVWMTFAVALFKLNSRGRDRTVYQSASESDQALNAMIIEVRLSENIAKTQKRRRVWVLFAAGIFGGFCSSVAGSGLDIAAFSILTLYFRVSEKVATPTSVVLMALNAVIGIVCRTAGLGGAYEEGQQEAVWEFISVCIPIVVIGAPLGATISAGLARHWLAYLIYVLDSVQFVSALVVIQPWSLPAPNNIGVCVASALTLVFGSAMFFKLASWGDVRGECDSSSVRTPSVKSSEMAPGSDVEGQGLSKPAIAADEASLEGVDLDLTDLDEEMA